MDGDGEVNRVERVFHHTGTAYYALVSLISIRVWFTAFCASMLLGLIAAVIHEALVIPALLTGGIGMYLLGYALRLAKYLRERPGW